MDGVIKHGSSSTKPPTNLVVKTNLTTVAARWNIKVLRGLEDALPKDPEADLTHLLSSTYLEQLKSFGESGGVSRIATPSTCSAAYSSPAIGCSAERKRPAAAPQP
jgi:hypothetical protein